MNTLKLNTIDLAEKCAANKPQGGSGDSGGSGGSTAVKWTGHADAEGLRAIGWTDEDIAYYQANGVNWNEEDDQYHLVSDDNKALYGVLNNSNIPSYKDRIVYLPKIDTSETDYWVLKFADCENLVAIPMLDTSKVTNMQSAFKNCYHLTCIPSLDMSNVTNMNSMFNYCLSLLSVPKLNTSNVTDMGNTFSNCRSLRSIYLDFTQVSELSLNDCSSLYDIQSSIDLSKLIVRTLTFYNNYSLSYIKFKNASSDLNFSSLRLTKESLLYLINNEAATSAITITLNSYVYTRLANDPDTVAALANHPNVSLAQYS